MSLRSLLETRTAANLVRNTADGPEQNENLNTMNCKSPIFPIYNSETGHQSFVNSADAMLNRFAVWCNDKKLKPSDIIHCDFKIFIQEFEQNQSLGAGKTKSKVFAMTDEEIIEELKNINS
jgi:hypothetical protein